MDGISDHCQVAFRNVRQSVDVHRRFPLNVFVGRWSDFFFFDSDWMSLPDFVEHVWAFLDVEAGYCACLWNLDASEAEKPRFFFVHEHTTAEDYRSLLAGERPGYGWGAEMERMACASDTGEWCMYCEPNNEVAVVGFRRAGASARYRSAMGRFDAAPIDQAIRDALSYGFTQIAASPEWHEAFLREYASRSV